MYMQVSAILSQRSGSRHFTAFAAELDYGPMYRVQLLGGESLQRICVTASASRQYVDGEHQQTDNNGSVCGFHGVLFAAAGVINWRSNQSASTLTSS